MSETAWDNCCWGVGQSASWWIGVRASIGLVSLSQSRRRAVGRVLLEIVWVEWRWDVSLAIGRRYGLSGWGFGGRRQCKCLGRIIGERRLYIKNYLCMKKSTMVDGNSYVS